MNEKALRALVEAGAVRRARIIADGARFRIEADTASTTIVVTTGKGGPKTWRTLDASAKWLRALGVCMALLDVGKWTPKQQRRSS